MKTTFTLLLLLVFISPLFAQRGNPSGEESPKIVITGQVLEEGSKAPLEYATIVFIAKDGSIATGGITNPQGNYSIEVPAGLYTVQFEFISY